MLDITVYYKFGYIINHIEKNIYILCIFKISSQDLLSFLVGNNFILISCKKKYNKF